MTKQRTTRIAIDYMERAIDEAGEHMVDGRTSDHNDYATAEFARGCLAMLLGFGRVFLTILEEIAETEEQKSEEQV